MNMNSLDFRSIRMFEMEFPMNILKKFNAVEEKLCLSIDFSAITDMTDRIAKLSHKLTLLKKFKPNKLFSGFLMDAITTSS